MDQWWKSCLWSKRFSGMKEMNDEELRKRGRESCSLEHSEKIQMLSVLIFSFTSVGTASGTLNHSQNCSSFTVHSLGTEPQKENQDTARERGTITFSLPSLNFSFILSILQSTCSTGCIINCSQETRMELNEPFSLHSTQSSFKNVVKTEKNGKEAIDKRGLQLKHQIMSSDRNIALKSVSS